jgi:hypothetical protein
MHVTLVQCPHRLMRQELWKSVSEWHRQFRQGGENVDDRRSGRSRSHRTAENVGKLRNLVHVHRRASSRAMAMQLNGKTNFKYDLGMKRPGKEGPKTVYWQIKPTTRWCVLRYFETVDKRLFGRNCHWRWNMVLFNIISNANDAICNGSSRHTQDPRKLTCRNNKLRQFSSVSSSISTVFTLNSFHKAKESAKFYYVQILTPLCHAVRRKRLDLRPNAWILQHNNAPAHKAVSGPKIGYWNVTPAPFPLTWFRMTSGCFQK